MFSHACLGSDDPPALVPFYDAVLAPLGIVRFLLREDGAVAGWRAGPGPSFYVGRPFNGGAAGVGNGTMIAFRAGSRDEVDQGHAAGLVHGGTCDGPPGLRPQYGPDYYGAYLRDPQGNKLHLVHRP